MKKVFTTLAFVLAFVLSMTMITACADNASEPQASAAPQVSVPTPPASPAPAATAQPAAVPTVSTPEPTAEQKEVDQSGQTDFAPVENQGEEQQDAGGDTAPPAVDGQGLPGDHFDEQRLMLRFDTDTLSRQTRLT